MAAASVDHRQAIQHQLRGEIEPPTQPASKSGSEPAFPPPNSKSSKNAAAMLLKDRVLTCASLAHLSVSRSMLPYMQGVAQGFNKVGQRRDVQRVSAMSHDDYAEVREHLDTLYDEYNQ